MRRAGIVLMVCLCLTSCRKAGLRMAEAPWPPLLLSPCHVARLAEEVLCGAHDVFEDRQARSGRTLSIHVTVMPALGRASAPDPLLIFAGGPGQGARGYAAVVSRFFGRVRRTRDVVLIDLRGTGDSGRLGCPVPADELGQLRSMLDGDDLATRCLASLDADPRRYTHAAALADVDEIRQRLGYTKVNLWGGSWGTRAALLYALTFPQAVRFVVLDGAVPLDMGFPRSVADDAERAFGLLAATCVADEACTRVFGDVRATLGRLLERLEATPADITLRHPRTGGTETVHLTRDLLAEIVRVSLYTAADAARLPQVLAHLDRGDAGPLVAHATRLASMTTDDMALAATLSVLCSEDVPLSPGIEFAAGWSETFLQSAYADTWRGRCLSWPRGPALTFPDNASSPAPALILSGAHDPVTPPRWGERMRAHFPFSLHIVVPGAAHNTSFSGCVPDLIARFLDTGPDSLGDTSCVDRVRWPPLVVSDAGTAP